jgi:protein-S-isoprenylcysteine O-methyltransferase Ste14
MAETQPKDRPNTIHWPPILYVVTLALAGLMHWQWPLPPLLGAPIGGMIGWPMFALGLGLGISGLLRFRAVGTSFDPTASADALATGGIYQFTRNPMYLGAVVGFFGLGLALHWAWLLVLTPLMAFAVRSLAIIPEEAYLDRRFGEVYRAYKSSVRRWL